MVAYDSRRTPDPRQVLSPETAERLRHAIAQHWTAGTPPEQGPLRDALRAVAAEARERQLRPEELLVALREVADAAAGGTDSLASLDEDTRWRFRTWLVSSCLVAYYETPRD